MSIDVKAINGILVLKVHEDIEFDMFMKDLGELLEQSIFQQDGYYPRAFFDFGNRVLSDDELIVFLLFLREKKRVLFDGISTDQKNQLLEIRHEQVRNGEEEHVHKQTLFLGTVNPGSYVYCYENVYFLNVVKGTIVLMREDVKIFGQQFSHAQIVINQKSLHDLTTSALTTVYYKEGEIKVVKEDTYEQNYSHYIG